MRSPRLFPAPVLAGALLAALAAMSPASAAELRVTAPPGYSATPMAPTGQQTARYAVRKPGDPEDGGCQVAYSPAPQNRGMSQEDLNARIRSPGWQSIERVRLEPIYAIRGLNTVELGHRTGLQIQADFKPLPSLPPRAQQLRSLFAIVESPQGRTLAVCVFEKAEADARQGEFLALLRGITAP
ncbi:hypothetical protein ACFFMP_18035 [Pseudoroseomonas cervicalis]|uniref:Tat pathway signal sequence domain protein n=1 Tax=Pseudoroseomonas cervicalis ATCC 49957 TaxID=525371 RepID=D5RR88_9PROT|nr:hypothetical protein [Pseudoroseomonas cervicalis]EFH10194.1 hypothetical protein HMPREF0731_3600 [Pseudoroseomonas cervicalis ATCC 49957]